MSVLCLLYDRVVRLRDLSLSGYESCLSQGTIYVALCWTFFNFNHVCFVNWGPDGTAVFHIGRTRDLYSILKLFIDK